MQIKAVVRYDYTPTRKVKFLINTPNASENAERLENSYIASENEMIHPL